MDKDILDKVRYSTDLLQEIEEGQSKGGGGGPRGGGGGGGEVRVSGWRKKSVKD